MFPNVDVFRGMLVGAILLGVSATGQTVLAQSTQDPPSQEQPNPSESGITEKPPQRTGANQKTTSTPSPSRLIAADYLDEQGRVPPFSFSGQPWGAVLQWVADFSGSSLDWQELPDDTLQLSTQRTHSVAEVRDLVNRQLLLRGYAMLEVDRMLSVFKIDRLEPSLVPRVATEDLYDRLPHEFVKVTLHVPAGGTAEVFATDIRKVLSPHAPVVVLAASNRLLVMDAVTNLRAAVLLVNEERAARDAWFREFAIEHVRAEQVAAAISQLLGIQQPQDRSEQDLRLERERIDLLSRLQRSGSEVQGMIEDQLDSNIRLVVDRRKNTLLVAAPPEAMRIIERAVQTMDVPRGEAMADHTGTAPTLRRYVLSTTNPDSLAAMLKDVGGLDPRAELRADAGSQSLFVKGSEADHQKVQALVDRLDRPERSFEVVQLRRLSADAVAATIDGMLSTRPSEEELRQRSRNNGDTSKLPREGFRVDADVENNRLLLWANAAEMGEVKALLTKLGEIADENARISTVRVLQAVDGMSTEQLLEQVKQAWSAVSDQPLIINRDDGTSTESNKAAPTKGDRGASTRQDRSVRSRDTAAGKVNSVAGSRNAVHPRQAAVNAQPAILTGSGMATPRDSSEEKESLKVFPQKDGRIILRSSDQGALEAFENLYRDLSPEQPRFRVFKLKHASAFSVWLNLTEFFEAELSPPSPPATEDDRGPRFFTSPSPSLSEREQLQFVYDTPSSTILVANASPTQLADIESLIKLYDQPTPEGAMKTRRTTAIKLQYASAAAVAASLKDVYRDLLSSRDKEFDSEDKKQLGFTTAKPTIIKYGESDSVGLVTKKSEPFRVRFDGSLSLGVDERSNMLMISAEEPIFDSIVDMVEQLDQKPPEVTTELHRVRNIRLESLRSALSVLGPSVTVGAVEPAAQPERATSPSESKSRERRDEDRQQRKEQPSASKEETKRSEAERDAAQAVPARPDAERSSPIPGQEGAAGEVPHRPPPGRRGR